MGVEPKIGVFTPQNGWFIVENPMNKWMIWGFSLYFWVDTHMRKEHIASSGEDSSEAMDVNAGGAPEIDV